jgi:phospholipase/carboxylesterase
MQRMKLGELEAVVAGGLDGSGGGSGPTVVLLHGYGAPGDDLVPLCRVIDVPKNVRFVFPAAPIALDPRFPGQANAWWPLDMEELLEIAATGDVARLQDMDPKGMTEARVLVEGLLDALAVELAVNPETTVIGGFSQGGMLATELVLGTERPFAGLAILSATLVRKKHWTERAASRSGLPVLQSHGRADPVVPYENAEALRDLLIAAGLDVEWISFGGGHAIPDSVVSGLGELIRTATNSG